jgi:hypothetical protein
MNKLLTFLIPLFAVAAFGADPSGNWKGTADFGGNAIERTFTFKVDGKKLTGETSSEMMGKSVIADGVIDGDDVSFAITGNIQGNEIKIHYKGKIHGDEMKLTANTGEQEIAWNLKKIP